MMSMRQESGVVELHFDCHYKCTMWIINQVKLIGCWAYCRYFIYLIHPFFCMNPLCCPLPLCIHGNSCLLGSTTGNQQCLNRLGSDHHLWETYVNFCRLLTNESEDSIWIVSLWYWSEGPQVRPSSFLTLIGWITIFSCGADIIVSDSVYFDSFWLLSFWYLEPFWHFTAQQCPIMLIDCCVFCWLFCEFC